MQLSRCLRSTRVFKGGLKATGNFSQRTGTLIDGIAVLEDGRVYKGSFDEAEFYPVGKQHQLEEDGDIYVGSFNKEWQRDGSGRSWLADGTTYDGRFESDDFVEGTVRIPSGIHETVFRGRLKDEMFVEGTLQHVDYTYTGQFADNRPHGRGKLAFQSGEVMDGTFRCGALHGTDCSMKLSGGFVFTGEFVDGHIRRGTLRSSLYTYEGEFDEQGKAHGEGIQIFLAASKKLYFSGHWFHGVLREGSCKDEDGFPIDYRSDSDAQNAITGGFPEKLATGEYFKAKKRETDTLFREMNKSYVEDAKRVEESTGHFPSKYELGYEPSVAEMANHAPVMESMKLSDDDTQMLPPDPRYLMSELNDRANQKVLSERLSVQYAKFQQGKSDKPGDDLKEKLNVQANLPWGEYTFPKRAQ